MTLAILRHDESLAVPNRGDDLHTRPATPTTVGVPGLDERHMVMTAGLEPGVHLEACHLVWRYSVDPHRRSGVHVA